MSLKSFGLALACAMTVGGASFAQDIELHHPYAISTGVSAQSGAAFMTIHNHGVTDDALIDVQSTAARLVELHSHTMSAEGVMSMVHVTDPVSIPAGGELLLNRGGYHIMFMGLTVPFTDGTMIPVTLVFAQSDPVTIDIPVDQSQIGEMGNMPMQGATNP